MKFDEKIDITDLQRCAENFYKTVDKALCIEIDLGSIAQNEEEDEAFLYRFVRSAVIQTFEITMEQSWKMIQRWVKINADSKIGEKPKRELFRIAYQCGLITDPVVWWGFYDGRNKTSYTYHEEVAEEVYQLAKNFRKELGDFIRRLEERR